MANILTKLFGNKSQRDLKEVKPFLDSTLAVYPTIHALDNDGLLNVYQTEHLVSSCMRRFQPQPRQQRFQQDGKKLKKLNIYKALLPLLLVIL